MPLAADPATASPAGLSLPQPSLVVVPFAHLRRKVLRRPVESAQCTSFVFTVHLVEAGLDASIGTVGDALDNALMESTIGVYKTELIKKDGPWRSLPDVELATAGYVDWYNTTRLHTAIGGVPPAEFEVAYYAKIQPDPEAGSNT